MNNEATISKTQGLFSDQIGWRYYNTIKKKAMEREFSASGLLISLSVAFFIVVGCASVLNVIYSSL